MNGSMIEIIIYVVRLPLRILISLRFIGSNPKNIPFFERSILDHEVDPTLTDSWRVPGRVSEPYVFVPQEGARQVRVRNALHD